MTFDISNNKAENRYEIRRDGELLGIAEYRMRHHVIGFIHTETDPQHGGEGIGTALVSYALDDAAAQHLAVLPLCPFVQETIAKHPKKYLHLVPEGVRGHFDLPDSVN